MTPGLDLRLALGRVRDEVLKNTGSRQEPFVYGSLGGAEIALVSTGTFQPQAVPSPVPAQPQASEAERAWAVSKDTTSIALLEAFAARFKDTFYADLARARIEELRRQQVAVATPVPPPAAKPVPPPSPAAPSSEAAWVKLCERTNGGSTSCATRHERVDPKTGKTIAAVALSDADEGGRRRLQVLVPLGVALQPGMRVTTVPKEMWEKVQRNEKLDKAEAASLSPASIAYRLCDPAGCRGETDVSTQLLEQMRTAGGLFVESIIGAASTPVAIPIPLNGFNSVLTGPPIDNRKYQEARETLFRQLNTANRPPALSTVASYAPAMPPPAPKDALKQPTPMGGWIKICENTALKDKEGRDERRLICMTDCERLDAGGVTQISAAVRRIEGSGKQYLAIMVPLGVLLHPAMRATIYPRDAWNKLLNGEAVAQTKSEFLTYTLCSQYGCTAEVEAAPRMLDQIRAAGGMLVAATSPSGHPLTYPVPFAGFSEAHAGAPVDGAKYMAERRALLDLLSKARQK